MSTDPKKEDIESRHIVTRTHAARAYFQGLSCVRSLQALRGPVSWKGRDSRTRAS